MSTEIKATRLEPDDTATATRVNAYPKSKRRGRKPGSKNKPKASSIDSINPAHREACASRDRQIGVLQDLIDGQTFEINSLKAQLAAFHVAQPTRPLRDSLDKSPMRDAIDLLRQSLEVRPSAMDSESRLMELVRQQQRIAHQVSEQLLAVL